METEKRLAQYLTDTKYGDLPQESVDVNKKMILAVTAQFSSGLLLSRQYQ